MKVNIIGKTKDTNTVDEKRADQIKEYIKENNIKKYLIIDDIQFNKYKEYFGDKFIKANYLEGFNKTNLEQALNVFEKYT